MTLKNKLQFLRNHLEQWWTINYHGLRTKVNFNPRSGVCECCGKKCKSQRHHWLYAFTRKEVQADPNLSYKYTCEVCFFPCHEMGNSLRKLFELDPKLQIKSNNKVIKKLLDLREKALKEAKKDGRLK